MEFTKSAIPASFRKILKQKTNEENSGNSDGEF